jgi:hypothetical protein
MLGNRAMPPSQSSTEAPYCLPATHELQDEARLCHARTDRRLLRVRRGSDDRGGPPTA